MDVIGQSDDIKMFCLDDSGTYSIKMTGTDTGSMDYSFRVFSPDGTLINEYTASGIPITPDTIISTDSDHTQNITLNIDENGDGTVDGTAALSEESIAVNPTDNIDFGRVDEGYSAQAEKEISVTNTGSSTISSVKISLAGNNPDAFSLDKQSIDNLPVIASDSFHVSPRLGLSPGTYNATVKVETLDSSFSFDVNFKVLESSDTTLPVYNDGDKRNTSRAKAPTNLSPTQCLQQRQRPPNLHRLLRPR
jgi:hypothetical protein